MIPPWVWGALVENSSPICNTTMWFYMGLGSMAKTGNSDPHNSTCKPPHSIQPVPIESYRRDLQFKNVGFLWGRIGHVNLHKIKRAEPNAQATNVDETGTNRIQSTRSVLLESAFFGEEYDM